MYRIGSGAGFSGDRIDAPQSVVAEIAAAGEGGAIIFETMGERTLALGQLARRKDPDAGYEPLLEQFLEPVLAACIAAGIVIVGNFGCANPPGAAAAIAAMAARLGLGPLRIAIVEGDDIGDRFDLASAEHWDGDGRMAEPEGDPLAVNVYLGARAIADAIAAGAQVVVTGRVADPSLAVGPLVAHFGWAWTDLDRIAAATLAGHLLECGSQVSGGYFADPGFKDVPDPDNIGFPIAEVEEDGRFVITKARGTGGIIDLRTVKEQILYEIHDPAAYLTPDVTLDVTGVTLEQVGHDRVAVRGARGTAPPARLKATASYTGDWLGEAEISYAGPNAARRATLAIEIIEKRLARRRIAVVCRADIIGLTSAFDGDDGALRRGESYVAASDLRVRAAFSGDDEGEVRKAIGEVMALYCCGPAGGGGIRTALRRRVHTRSYLVPRSDVSAGFRLRQAAS